MNTQASGPSPSRGRRFAHSIHEDNTGGTAVEFALILPVTAMLLFAVIKFGIVLNNQVQLTHAASAAARQLSISRGSTTPYSSTMAAMRLSAPRGPGSIRLPMRLRRPAGATRTRTTTSMSAESAST